MVTVLDLGYGTGSATRAWRAHGHKVVGVDLNGAATLTEDYFTKKGWRRIMEKGPYHFVWFSPNCAIFSMANMKHEQHFDQQIPISNRAKHETEGIQFVLEKIQEMEPALGWVMENPRALMRIMPFVQKFHRVTVSYCQYQKTMSSTSRDSRMKPTDLFGHIPAEFRPKLCRNGASCHDPAPRGSQTGTQGMNSRIAGMVPYGLSLELYQAAMESNGKTYPRLEDF